MSTIREIPVTSGTNFHNWANAVKDQVGSNKLNPSADFVVKNTLAGTSLTLHPKYKYNPPGLSYITEYDPTAGYNVGDVVILYPSKSYDISTWIPGSTFTPEGPVNNYSSNPAYGQYSSSLVTFTIQIRYNDTTVGNYVASALLNSSSYSFGTYVCVCPIPSIYDFINSYITSDPPYGFIASPGIVPDIPQSLASLKNQFYWGGNQITAFAPLSAWAIQRYSNISYYPTSSISFPIFDHTASYNKNNLQLLNGRYWEQVGSPIGGGSGPAIEAYDVTGNTSYSAGQRVYVASEFTLNGVTCLPGTFELISGYRTPTSPVNGQIPFIPFVPGYSNWWPIAAGMVGVSTCASGVSTTVYINSTGLT
jgi:hypothetical protein